MIGSDYVLEVAHLYHTAEVDTGGCLSSDTSTLVLKGTNLTLHSGEVMAILGSKGSGKKCLLDVIAKRAEGNSRGQVLLNGSPLTKRLFQQRCGYVTHSVDFIPGLSVAQTLHYTPTVLTGYLKVSKVRQVMADLALSQVGSKRVENLTLSEKRRLAIGVQLVRDPVMLLLDEPTHGLDPLSAYLLISILSNTAKKSGCGILLSLEKPRSDVFPFLDRALFLCLGGVVYSGGTRAMLEYFHAIGFPCPQLENPLMYYLCLSTVDRRSRDRFLESSQQIEALVDRFARELPLPESPMNPMGSGKVPLAYGKPGELKVWGVLYLRLLASTFSCSGSGLKNLALRLLALPLTMCLLWLFYTNIGDDSQGLFSKNGMILNILALTIGSSILTTITIFPAWRKRYVQENAEGLYTGATLLIAYDAISIPFAFISSVLATCVIYPLVLNPNQPSGVHFLGIVLALWSCYVVTEQMCILFHLFVKTALNTAITVVYILGLCLTLASGTLRSFKGLSGWLQDNTKVLHMKYTSQMLFNAIFLSHQSTCVPSSRTLCPNIKEYVFDRVGKDSSNNTEIIVALAIAVGLAIFNMIIYTIPLPRFVQRKFKEV